MLNLSVDGLLQKIHTNTPVSLKGFGVLGTVREALRRTSQESGQRITFDPASDSGLMAYLSSASPQGAEDALGGAMLGWAIGALLSDPGQGAMIGARLGMLAKRGDHAGQGKVTWRISATHDEQGIPVITLNPVGNR